MGEVVRFRRERGFDPLLDMRRAAAYLGVGVRTLEAVKPAWRFFFVFLYRTGLRISEAVGLTWADVEFGAQPCVHIHQQFCRGKRRGLKTKASRRTLPLSPETAKQLWKMRATAETTNAPVFATRVGTPYSSSNVANRVLTPARVKAGLPWVTFHTFRHTCASMLFEQGQDIIRVQHWLGHESAAFTARVYVHMRESDLGNPDFFDVPLVRHGAADTPTEPARTVRVLDEPNASSAVRGAA